MGIDTLEVLRAAGSKWNFLPFRPGLVGGHCIGVDPYYLTHKASVLGYHPELMLAARRINSRMGIYVAHRVMALMARERIHVVGARVLVLGLTFKEDCPDLRNTRVADLVRELESANARVDVHDPWADADEARRELGIEPVATLETEAYDAVVMAVGHACFREMDAAALRALGKPGGSVFYDIKYAMPEGVADERI
jgi:UDP-N-acetyl-D-galactosamine dehydrogenase